MNAINYLNKQRAVWLLRLYMLLLFVAGSINADAHVGSSGVIVQRKAGTYQVLVSIQPPDVVPGTATVTVFVEQGRVNRIKARPIYFDSGDKGAPTYDELTRLDANRYEGDVWLMESGSSSVELAIAGPDGPVKVVVPVMAVATAVRTMPQGTGIGLALMGLLLIVMLITIIGASNADGIAAPGQTPPPTLKRRRVVGMGVGAVVLALLLTGWRSWWTSSAESYKNEQLYRPLPIKASVVPAAGGQQLTIRLDTTGFGTNWQKRRQISFVIPDHGKLMHTFVVRTPGLDAFAHLHPNRSDTLTYNATLPPLPAGTYLLFSDIVYRSGYAETLTDTIQVPGQPSSAYLPLDTDDSWLVATPMGVKAGAENGPHLDNDMVVCGKPGASTKLADGSSMLWMDKPGAVLESGKLYNLKFAVADAAGKAAPLEPYLGMGGHAVILRSDGSVYIHLHPVGTYSMAAEGSLTGRLADTARTFQYPDAQRFRDSIDRYVSRLKTLPEGEKNKLLMAAMPPMNHTMAVNNMVEFPYAFPRAGHYRIWVQVKRNGQVLTGVFDTQVNDPLL
ncbi:hypothetical protein [Spirosoma utsteinense]|uniref:Uncharacterized protein n=2 Tax=Spirosoma utsteinense TaxID=2585773 RepID=A0ABR6WAE2_9BACT|nr:hypothetical protein [Spirosoma utsteinense]MBC3783890.1 hypothetical protein [Spirosoma utsteinense]MBC3793530.1 hypothetical protein [Spirosoma utsteinense]